MWGMFANYLKLFAKGRLFRDSRAVFRQWLIGFAATLIAVLVLVKCGAPLWLGVILAALAAGGLQPFLFKNLKYA
jgi:hypothetical protein